MLCTIFLSRLEEKEALNKKPLSWRWRQYIPPTFWYWPETITQCTTFRSASPLCILELSRQIHREWQPKYSYIYVIYKVLVYVQTSQPTTCFGLFQLGHLQVGHKGQRNYTIRQIISLKSGGRDLVYKFGACVQTGPLTLMIIVQYCIVPMTFMFNLKMA